MELSNDWHKQTNVKLFDILSSLLKPPRTPKMPKPTHAYTIAEKAPEVVTAPGVYFPAEKGDVIPLESRQEGGEVKPDLGVPDWKSKFTPEMEKEFQNWYAERAKNMGLNPNPDHPKHFYDTRGAWLAGERSTTDHLPDKYKLPGHPTFSDQSTYYRPGMKAGKWEGGKYIPIEAKPQALSSFAPTKEQTPEKTPEEAGSTIPLIPKQEGGVVSPTPSLQSLGFHSPSEGFRGPSAGFSTAGNLTYEKNKIGESLGPLSETSKSQYKEMNIPLPESPALSAFAPAPFKPKPKSPAMGAPPPNPEDAVMTEAERRRQEFINSPSATPLYSRQGGGPISPDLQEGITEEELRKREAERNRNVELGKKMWERHLKTQQEKDFPERLTPVGEAPIGATITETTGEKKIGEATPTSVSEAKPETMPKNLPSGGLSDYGFTKETLPSGETRYTLPEGQGTATVGRERFFAGGEEVPKGTSRGSERR